MSEGIGTGTTNGAPATEIDPAPPAGVTAGSPLGAPAAEGGEATEAGTATEAAPAGEKKVEGEGGKDALTVESYADLKLPEGVTVDEPSLTTFKEYAVENGLSPEAAQKAMDLHVDLLNKSAEAFVTQQQEAWNGTLETWKAELAKDPEFSGEKAKVSQATIAQALDEYGSPEARQAFDLTGAGWNPAIVKMVHKMAVALSEGKPVAGAQPVGKTGGSLGDRFYGNSEGT